jgi:hypothetical protein
VPQSACRHFQSVPAGVMWVSHCGGFWGDKRQSVWWLGWACVSEQSHWPVVVLNHLFTQRPAHSPPSISLPPPPPVVPSLFLHCFCFRYFFENDRGKKIRPALVLLMSFACNASTTVTRTDQRLGSHILPSQRRLAEITCVPQVVHVSVCVYV